MDQFDNHSRHIRPPSNLIAWASTFSDLPTIFNLSHEKLPTSSDCSKAIVQFMEKGHYDITEIQKVHMKVDTQGSRGSK